MARSLTGIITIYNKQYRPKAGGVCVANHTTPYDVVILSTDNCYSLVSHIQKNLQYYECLNYLLLSSVNELAYTYLNVAVKFTHV